MEGRHMPDEEAREERSYAVEEKKSEPKPVRVDAVEIFKDADGQWRWKAKSRNGKTIATSGEGYRNRQWARRMAVEMHPDARVVWGPK